MDTGPFVGRGAELALLRRAVEGALAGAAACAWVVGAAGIGKTRLVHEIATYARLRGVAVRWSGQPDPVSASSGDGTESFPDSAHGSAELVIIDGVETAAEHAAAIEHLTATGGATRLVLGTSRRPPAGQIAEILGKRHAAILVLGGLDTDALGRLLRALAGESRDGELVAAALRSARGNPGRAQSWLSRQR